MRYDDLMKMIRATPFRSGGWLHVVHDVFTLKEHVLASIQLEDEDESDEHRACEEEWAAKVSDRPPTWSEYSIFFASTFVTSFRLASVDGGRAKIPPPKHGTREIDRGNYLLALAVDVHGTLDDYIQRAGLRVSLGIGPDSP